MGSNKEFIDFANHVKEMEIFQSGKRPNCLPQYGRTIVPPNTQMKSCDMLQELYKKPEVDKFIEPHIEIRQRRENELKRFQELEQRNKAIIGQERQERIVWNKQKLPVKLFKYWRTKIK